MFGTQIVLYTAIYPEPSKWSWVPHVAVNWGRSTHFVHSDEPDEKYPDGIPLNREWSVDFGWLFLYSRICYIVDLDINGG